MESQADFNPIAFEKKLTHLKETQESIEGLSQWCLARRQHHKKIVQCWLNVLKRVKVGQRLSLFYLANDVIQKSKRKKYEFVESWGLNLQKATPLVRDEKVRSKILRIFTIWEDRKIYDEEFLSDLTGLLSAGGSKKAVDDDLSDFQPQALINKIRQCTVLEADTDTRLKHIHECNIDLNDMDNLRATLKKKSDSKEAEKELTEGIHCVERYTVALQRELVARETLLVLIKAANRYYALQKGEVKVVAYAYKNFGARVRCLKRKLMDMIAEMPDAPAEDPAPEEYVPSPPKRDEDVPSPGPDEDIELPRADDQQQSESSYNIDKTFSSSISENIYSSGFSSFLKTTEGNPFSMFSDSMNESTATDTSASRIEVIETRTGSDKGEFNINDFLKTLLPAGGGGTGASTGSGAGAGTDMPPAESRYETSTEQESPDAVALALGLVSPVRTSPSARTSTVTSSMFYGSLDTSNIPGLSIGSIDEQDYSVNQDSSLPWANSTQWDASSLLSGVGVLSNPPPAAAAPAVTAPAAEPFHTLATPNTEPLSSLSIPPLSSLPPAMLFADTPESPPPSTAPPRAPPLVSVDADMYCAQEMGQSDVDHRGLLPPPPPPPVIPGIGAAEDDVDHRLMPNFAMMPPTTMAGSDRQHAPMHKADVDHRNLISLTTHPGEQETSGSDQDYRMPPVVAPSDIVESVDMDLSEDDEGYNAQVNYKLKDESGSRKRSYNNNKVLIGEPKSYVSKDSDPYGSEKLTDTMTSPPLLPTHPFDLPDLSFPDELIPEATKKDPFEEDRIRTSPSKYGEEDFVFPEWGGQDAGYNQSPRFQRSWSQNQSPRFRPAAMQRNFSSPSYNQRMGSPNNYGSQFMPRNINRPMNNGPMRPINNGPMRPMNNGPVRSMNTGPMRPMRPWGPRQRFW